MSNNKRDQDLLQKLNMELQSVNTDSKKEQQLVDNLAAHVEEVIDQGEALYESLIAKLEAGIAEMETSHLSLTTLMKRVVSGLSNMGV